MSAAVQSGTGYTGASGTGTQYSNGHDANGEAHLRLDESRRELKDLFIPPEEPVHANGFFPRSKVMRKLTGNGGLALLAAGAGGLLLAKPRLLIYLVRMIPMGAIVRMAAVRFMAGRG